jgi:hypothetical protein
MTSYPLILGALCVFRVTHLLHAEDGPWDLFVRLRRLAGAGFWGSLLDCFYCASLWVAAPFAVLLGAGWTERLLLIPALSAGAILIERVSARAAPPPPAHFQEDPPDVMLRSEEDPGPDPPGAPER